MSTVHANIVADVWRRYRSLFSRGCNLQHEPKQSGDARQPPKHQLQLRILHRHRCRHGNVCCGQSSFTKQQPRWAASQPIVNFRAGALRVDFSSASGPVRQRAHWPFAFCNQLLAAAQNNQSHTVATVVRAWRPVRSYPRVAHYSPCVWHDKSPRRQQRIR